jgi:hypothetical protein
MGRFKRNRSYVLFGVGFFIVWFLFKLGGMPDIGKAVASTAIDVTLSMSAMILTVEVLAPAFARKQGYFRFCLLCGALVLVAGSAIIFSQLALMGSSVFAYQKNIAKYQEHFFYWFWSDLIFGSYILVAFLCLTGMAVKMAFDRIRSSRQMEMLESENIRAELMMLQHQVNPHFIFNTLNTIYYKIDRANTGARQILEQFSELLRYQLYESNGPFVYIENELRFLHSYIGVQQQRFNHDCAIEVSGFEALNGFQIAPYLLVPIVENCFKHVKSLKDGTSIISIRGELDGNTFKFYTENSSCAPENPGVPGIGIENLRRRLELLYNERYSFQTIREQHMYKTYLSISIL